METVFRICLLVAGIINSLPAVLAFLPARISTSYGIEVPNRNYELLLRHRAVLFLLVGGLLVYSAATKKYYELAVSFGLISMVSFVVLYFVVGPGVNSELKKVMLVDLGAIMVLALGYTLYYLAVKK